MRHNQRRTGPHGFVRRLALGLLLFGFLGQGLALPQTSGSLEVPAQGQLSLGRPFQDHMVLPRGTPVPVWGSAPPQASLEWELGMHRGSTRSDAQGRWRLELPSLDASAEPQELRIRSGDQQLALQDVLVGDVWLCAGQSNMALPLERSAEGARWIDAEPDSSLRLWQQSPRLHPSGRRYPLELLRSLQAPTFLTSAGWQRTGPETAAGFSAVAWHFGRSLREHLGVPIGLIHVAVGGSPMEAWIPEEALRGSEPLRPLLRNWLDNPQYPAWCRQRARLNLSEWLDQPEGEAPHHPFEPGFLYDAGMRDLERLPIRGVLWYQGESNATEDGGLGAPVPLEDNAVKLQALVDGWRQRYRRPDLPVLMVQLPGLDREWPIFREAQAQLAAGDPHTQLAITIDLGHPSDVHPTAKRPVGERLARLARSHVHAATVVPTGPELAGFKPHPRGGLVLSWRHARGLATTDGQPPRTFAMAGSDGVFIPAQATIEGETVWLRAEALPEPKFVRYAWSADPWTNLVNGAGLPAAPFRTDTLDLGPKVRIACIGDSITLGFGLTDPRREAYPAQLEACLGPDYAVRSFARAGGGIVQRSRRGPAPRAFRLGPEHRAALAWAPDVVVCNLGINDLMDWEAFGKQDFARDYAELVSDYRALPTKPRILLWSPLAPLFPGHAFHGKQQVQEIEAEIRRVAAELGLETVNMRAPLAQHPEWFAKDHIHPNAAASLAIAQQVRSILEALR